MQYLKGFKIFEQTIPIPSGLTFYTRLRKGRGVTSKGIKLNLSDQEVNTAWELTQNLYKLHKVEDRLPNLTTRALQNWLWVEMEHRGLLNELINKFGGVKGRGLTKKQLLENIRLSIVQSLKKMEKNKKSKCEIDEACKKVESWLSDGSFIDIRIYNSAWDFWPILSDNHPSDSYDNFSRLFIDFWSNETCPTKWKKEYDDFIVRKSKISPDWTEKFKKEIPDIKTYGLTESCWLDSYARKGGLYPPCPDRNFQLRGKKKWNDVYEYYKLLPNEIKDTPLTKNKFVDGYFGQMTLWALSTIFLLDKNKFELEEKPRQELVRKAEELKLLSVPKDTSSVETPPANTDFLSDPKLMKKGLGQQKPKGRLKKFFKRAYQKTIKPGLKPFRIGAGGTGRDDSQDYLNR